MGFAKTGSGLSLLMAAAIGGLSVRAAGITVQNYSFETPNAHTAYGVSTYIDHWTTYGDAPFDTGTGGGPQSSGTGSFPNVNPDNSVNFSNADQSQVAYVFTKSGIATNRDGLEQILTTTYQAGNSYSFLVDVGLAGGSPGATEPFTFALFAYDPANPTARTVVGGRTIYNDTNTPLSKTALTTLTVSTPFLTAGSPLIDKQMGVEIFTALGSDTTVTAGLQYVYDNVRVNSVPEPGTFTLIAAAGMMLATGRRRRRPAGGL